MDCKENIFEVVTNFAVNLDPEGFRGLVSSEARELLTQTLKHIRAHEGSIWIVDKEKDQLVICHNTGPKAGAMTNVIIQPLSTGLVSECFKEGKSLHHKGLFRHRKRSDVVDTELEQKTHQQISVPFHISDKICGVISAVQLVDDEQRENVNWGFKDEDVALLDSVSSAIGKLVEYKWLVNSGTI